MATEVKTKQVPSPCPYCKNMDTRRVLEYEVPLTESEKRRVTFSGGYWWYCFMDQAWWKDKMLDVYDEG